MFADYLPSLDALELATAIRSGAGDSSDNSCDSRDIGGEGEVEACLRKFNELSDGNFDLNTSCIDLLGHTALHVACKDGSPN